MKQLSVVIPWRGFRCFTRLLGLDASITPTPVVIPWRGFRCFTLNALDALPNLNRSHVVIPWRGFRCFTRGRFVPPPLFSIRCCNPLAGI